MNMSLTIVLSLLIEGLYFPPYSISDGKSAMSLEQKNRLLGSVVPFRHEKSNLDKEELVSLIGRVSNFDPYEIRDLIDGLQENLDDYDRHLEDNNML
jgi:hypothetical protein